MNIRLLYVAIALAIPATVWGQQPELGPIDFATQIQPLLSDRCYTCHGPDAGKREADLRLDLEDDAKYYAIAPSDPDDSELLARIETDDPDMLMPPPSSKLPHLTDEEVQLIREWIKQGAKWGKHWAFTETEKAKPTVRGLFKDFDSRWIRNPIDAYVLERLESAGVEPSRQADRETLIRRISFDLTGLPPRLEDIEKFRQHDDFEMALNELVDRLLASSHYGERMASEWLDVARYSDTYGYQVDRDRRVWPWRDWVINSFNNNQRYDQFVTEQIAGDLLPNATQDQILATTFNRLHPQKVEGGSVEEEFRIEYVADRTQTFSTAFLGLTMECCRCHDHKYDPLSQKEYYQLSAFFDNIDEAGLYSFFTNSTPTPTLDLPTKAQRQQLAEAIQQVKQIQTEILEYSESTDTIEQFKNWYQSGDWQVELQPIHHESFEGPDGKLGGRNTSVPGKIGNAVLLTGDDAFNTSVGNFKREQPFSISLWMNAPDSMERAVVLHRSRAWTDAASRGYQLLIEDGQLSWSLIHFWPGNAMRIKTVQPLPVDQWVQVTVTYDGSSSASGLRIFVDGVQAETTVVRDKLTRGIAGGGGDNITIGERFRDFGFKGGKVDELRVFDSELTPVQAKRLWQVDSQVKDEEINVEPSREDALAYFLSCQQTFAKLNSELAAARKKLFELQNGLQQIMVMRELETPKDTYLLQRGAYDQPGEKVEPGVPGVLSAFDPWFPRNRLGLAQWLVDPENPLTARVYVNRVWQMLMGEGLVRTPEDFGVQGQAPTHPELLDWLAIDFVENGWDIKRLIKMIVTSSTYLQASTHRRTLLEMDPENRLLARGPRHRLTAEMLRDNALQVGGLLSSRQGGAASKPYEVEVSFKPVKRDQGEGLYRRSLYTYWKRTGPAPAMMTLGASKRDVCRVKRERASSPLQAFVLMNSPQFVEAARGLAENLVKKHGDNDEAILSEIFQMLTSRLPSDRESKIISKLFVDQQKYFADHPDAIEQYLEVGESPAVDKQSKRLAALTSVANALMGFDDAVMKK